MSPTPGPRTQLCGVILHPAGHTRSPAMHNAAFAALGIDAVYLAFDVAPAQLGAALAGARALGVRQLAVSIPHKEAVIPLPRRDRRDGAAHRRGQHDHAATASVSSARTPTGSASCARSNARRSSPGATRSCSAPAARRAPRSSGCSSAVRACACSTAPARAPSSSPRELGASGAGSLDELARLRLRRARQHHERRSARGRLAGRRPRRSRRTRSCSTRSTTRRARACCATPRRAARAPSAGKWWLVHQAAEQLAAVDGARGADRSDGRRRSTAPHG